MVPTLCDHEDFGVRYRLQAIAQGIPGTWSPRQSVLLHRVVEDQEYSSIRPLIDWLDYNGYRVVTKPTKEFVDSTGRRKVKGNMDIELAIDALELRRSSTTWCSSRATATSAPSSKRCSAGASACR